MCDPDESVTKFFVMRKDKNRGDALMAYGP
jgi:hypothetical protein